MGSWQEEQAGEGYCMYEDMAKIFVRHFLVAKYIIR